MERTRATRRPGATERGGWVVQSEIPGRLRLHHPAVGKSAAVRSRIEGAVLRLNSRVELAMNPLTSTILLRFDPRHVSRDQVLTVLSDVVASPSSASAAEQPHAAPRRSGGLAIPLSLGVSSCALVVSALAWPLRLLSLPATLLTLAAMSPIAARAARAVVAERKPKVDALDTVVIVSAIYYRQIQAAAFMIWVVDLARLLLDVSTRGARKALGDVFGQRVRRVRLVRGDSEVECDLAQVERGDIVVVRSGEQIPVDGVVVSGDALVDESPLTGESVPAEKSDGDKVFAMTAAMAGTIRVEVSETGEATTAAKMVEAIKRSLEHRIRLLTRSERFADAVVVPTLGLGVAARMLRGPSSMMAVFNADYDTGIRFAGPIALLSSLSTAARNGILVKNGSILESLPELDVIVFDKTGTLTGEIPRIERIVSFTPDYGEGRILELAAAAEHRLTHPLARAIIAEAARAGLSWIEVSDSDYHIGLGVSVRIDDKAVHVGSWRYLEQQGIRAADGGEPVQSTVHGGSRVFVATEGRAVGCIEFWSSPRPEAASIIETLRTRRGIREIHLLSGDTEAATRSIAGQLQIETARWGVAPADKAEYVRALQSRGLKVGMVGDGVNDSPALATADCSFSLAGATDIAKDVADVVFLDGTLRSFDLLFDISANLTRNVRQSLLLTAVPNTVLIAGAMLGVFGLPASLVLNNAFNAVSAANGFRAQRGLPGR